ncbi:MAG: hypothetical protein ACLGI6_05980 [Gammaproteobacteria bacterium]
MLTPTLAALARFKAGRLTRRSRYKAQLDDLPAGLFPYWAASAHREFEGIRRDAFFFTCAAEALMQFFECVAHSSRECALPSKAADSVWHAWLRYSPMGLEQFCAKHFFRVIDHVEAADMRGPLPVALAVCLVKARMQEGGMRAGMHLPRVFAVDRQLRMAGGYGYSLNQGRVGFTQLNGAGKPTGATLYPDLFTPELLLTHGLIDASEAEWARRRLTELATASSDSSGSSGSDSGSFSSSSDSASGCDSSDGGGGDSGCDSGSSCGSSCGSGCGGGGGGD